ncbi:MAG TPA: tetratricopeptide repeat protein [Cytophaga sp.]|jgi:tetratricopeptide (TPR) repeat protein|nr:tetratricopeptide repeat protein [Cytophaga sp.]
MKYIILLCNVFFVTLYCQAQILISNKDGIEAASKKFTPFLETFSNCIVNADLDNCISILIKSAGNEYEKYLVAGALSNIDASTSFQLHKEAYNSNPANLEFALEHAIELHRKGSYDEAIALYENVLASVSTPENYYRINLWLSECYINTGDIDKCILNWQKCNFPRHHTSIDFALYSVHADTNLIRNRDHLRKAIKNGNHLLFYDLIYNDMNWKFDWWNTHKQEFFLSEDMLLLQNTVSKTSTIYKTIQAYIQIKNLPQTDESKAAIETILKNNKLILSSTPLPVHGGITSDLLRICFTTYILNENKFYTDRGNELLTLASKNKDAEFLNIYAHLQATVTGKVDESIDKLGWTQYKDERFAMSYFIGKGERNKLDDPELAQALIDFPNSAKIYWIKANCAVTEKREIKTTLIELIKLEFKTLGSDRNGYSSSLNNYISYLETLK